MDPVYNNGSSVEDFYYCEVDYTENNGYAQMLFIQTECDKQLDMANIYMEPKTMI